MARSLKAGLTAVLPGGSLYWMIVVYANTGDSWGVTGYVWSNIDDWSLMDAGYSFAYTSRLLSVTGIDTSFDPFDDAMAKISDVSFTLLNGAGDIEPTDFLGRKVEIRMG